ncbi:MAG: type II secretion system F family protein [Candidatus Colwellbacteria bacterium]|nr:type II secretion system F family protein [Candidatus Colwellbacteria bacterium]MBI3274175.1 type II secretion system F family protein [Candidatus Colwellbacteria bacterium]
MSKIFSRLNSLFLSVPLSEKVLFTKHLSMMSKSGMSTVESIRLIKRQVRSRGFAKILDKVIFEVENGQSLSAAFGLFKNTFGELFVSILGLGETSGTLSQSLDYLSSELKKSQQLKSKIRSALIYPAIVMFFTIGVVIALVFFVLPKLLSIFSSLSVGLPISTRILIFSANLIRNYYLFIGGAIIFSVVACIMLLRLPAIKHAVHRFMLVLPIIGRISKDYNMAAMTRTLGLLLKSGMKIVESVSTTSGIVSNSVYQRALKEAAEEIKKGEPLHKYLEKRSGIIPPTVAYMVEVGEKTGNLDTNLLYLAEFYENEVDETMKNLSSILEPALLVLMGAIVGFVAISIITPIYQISQGVK